jgi:putative hydrolase of the HAD superfamily
MTRQHLIIDADDTLWENNIFFEKAFDEFVDFLDHAHLSPPQVRDVLDAIEAVNAKIHGYGSKNFGRNLIQTYEKLALRPIAPDDLETIVGFAENILNHPIILRPGVDDTLSFFPTRAPGSWSGRNWPNRRLLHGCWSSITSASSANIFSIQRRDILP